MTARPRCPRGHFLPDAGPCRCTLPPPTPPLTLSPDLWHQGLNTRRRGRPIRDVTPTGSYL